MPHSKKKPGLSPGTVVFTGNKKVEQIFIHYVRYDQETHEEKTLHNHEQIIFPKSPETQVDWYDVRGLHDTLLIEQMGKAFEIHPLVLEDIADVHQRPKFDEYKKGFFLTARAFAFDKETLKIEGEQIAIYYRKGLLISFQENETDLFSSVRQRLKLGAGRVRGRQSDYLCFALLDNVVDHYYVVLDSIESEIERIEDRMLKNPDEQIRDDIHALRKELVQMRKSIMALREAISQFLKVERAFFDDQTAFFVRDLYDHTIQVMDMVESYRDMLNGLQDLHLSEISFRMNQVMQVLTIITSIFVPLSFLTGLYGMNFDNMPELRYRYGYFVLLGVMFLIFLGCLWYFRRKKWF